METKGSQENINQAHLHCETNSGSGDVNGGGGVGASYTLPGGAYMYNAYHTYAIDWSPGQIKWSLDGITYLTETPTSSNFTGANGLWAFDNHPFYLIFDICQGGGVRRHGARPHADAEHGYRLRQRHRPAGTRHPGDALFRRPGGRSETPAPRAAVSVGPA